MPLSNAVGQFDLDVASGAEPQPYAEDQFTEDDDGLSKRWYGRVWMNPPYGRDENPAWAKKFVHEAVRPDVTSITALVPANTGTGWFGDYYADADAFTFIHQRLTFGDADNNATFGSVIVSVGDFPAEYWDALESLPCSKTTMSLSSPGDADV